MRKYVYSLVAVAALAILSVGAEKANAQFVRYSTYYPPSYGYAYTPAYSYSYAPAYYPNTYYYPAYSSYYPAYSSYYYPSGVSVAVGSGYYGGYYGGYYPYYGGYGRYSGYGAYRYGRRWWR